MLVKEGLVEASTTVGKPLGIKKRVTAIIFAVTSANHSNTRRNPLPLYTKLPWEVLENLKIQNRIL